MAALRSSCAGPGCDQLVQAMAQRRALFAAQVRAFVEDPFRSARVDAQLDAWQAQIAPFVEEQSALAEQPSVEAWHSALEGLRMAIDASRARALPRGADAGTETAP